MRVVEQTKNRYLFRLILIAFDYIYYRQFVVLMVVAVTMEGHVFMILIRTRLENIVTILSRFMHFTITKNQRMYDGRSSFTIV